MAGGEMVAATSSILLAGMPSFSGFMPTDT